MRKERKLFIIIIIFLYRAFKIILYT
jgi:hypothetical protein